MQKFMQLLKNFLNLTYYTSEIDDFLAEFDKTHPKLSTSQRKEIEKYTRIYKLRAGTHYQATPVEPLWDKF